MAKFLGVRWFNTVGIVQVEDEYDGIQYYIKAVEGLNEVVDIQVIMDWGTTFPNNAGDVLFGRVP
jgi:hypothetical protein